MRVRFAAVTVVAAILTVSCTIARADSDSEALHFLDGGSLTTSMEVSLGFLYGAGGRPDGLGIPVSTVSCGAAAAAANPAGLAFLTGNALLIDALPPIGAPVDAFIDIEGRAADAIDDAVADIAAPDLEPRYPSVDAVLGQQAGMITGALAMRFGRVVAGAAIEEPMRLSLDLVDTGIEGFAETVKEEGDVDIAVRCMLDAAADLDVLIDRTTLAAGSALNDRWGIGVSLSRYYASAHLSADLRTDGVLSYGGQEYAFNDPSDPWYNRLGQSRSGDYEGHAFGWTAGVSYRPSERVFVDVCYARAPRLALGGELRTIENTLPAISDDGLDAEEISASQPTLTERKEKIEDDPLLLNLPSYLGAAASLRTRILTATLEYRRYQGSLGFAYQDYAEGVRLSDGIGVEMSLYGLRIGGGFIRGALTGESADDGSARENVLIPMANVGAELHFAEHVGVNTVVLALPLQVMKVSFNYEF